MKPIQTIAGAVLALSMAVPAAAGDRHDDSWYDYAKVIDSRPIVRIERVNHPHRECWNEQVHERVSQDGNGIPVILGGSLGGLLGHQFADGNARDVLTVAGALLGASVAHEVSANRRAARGGYRERVVERCERVDDYEEVRHIEGYEVTYRYRGQTFTKRMDHDPGERVRVRVSVTPTYRTDDHDHYEHARYTARRYRQHAYRL